MPGDDLGAWTARCDLEPRERGVLDGWTIGVKDCIDVGGLPTRLGSQATDPRPAPRDAAIVALLRSAGARISGKNAMHELGLGAAHADGPRATGRNPWDPERVTGGSSSGTAAAVAARQVRAGVGAEFGGSIRGPGAWCGLTALRPSTGHIPLDGCHPGIPLCDAVGPLATTASDVATFMDAVAPRWRAGAGMGPVTVADAHAWHPAGAEPEVTAAWQVFIAWLQREFGGMRDPLPDYQRLERATITHYWGATMRQAVGSYREVWPGRASLLGEEVADALAAAAEIPGTALAEAIAFRARAQADAAALFAVTRVLAMPAAGRFPPRFADLGPRDTAAGGGAMLPATLLGLPAIVFPIGISPGGLPISGQLMGGAGDDATLVAIVDRWQGETDWHARLPRVTA